MMPTRLNSRLDNPEGFRSRLMSMTRTSRNDTRLRSSVALELRRASTRILCLTPVQLKGSDYEDELAELLARFEAPVRLGRFGERVGAIDNRAQLAGEEKLRRPQQLRLAAHVRAE